METKPFIALFLILLSSCLHDSDQAIKTDNFVPLHQGSQWVYSYAHRLSSFYSSTNDTGLRYVSVLALSKKQDTVVYEVEVVDSIPIHLFTLNSDPAQNSNSPYVRVQKVFIYDIAGDTSRIIRYEQSGGYDSMLEKAFARKSFSEKELVIENYKGKNVPVFNGSLVNAQVTLFKIIKDLGLVVYSESNSHNPFVDTKYELIRYDFEPKTTASSPDF